MIAKVLPIRALWLAVAAGLLIAAVGARQARASFAPFACQNREFELGGYAGWVAAELGDTGASYGMLRARTYVDDKGSWERFRMKCLSGGEFAIQSVANQRYVSVELAYSDSNQYMLRARASTIGPWERFTFVQRPVVIEATGAFEGYLRSSANGRLVSAEYAYQGSRWGMLRARTFDLDKGLWEQFELVWR